jgi:hypothetical protein
MRFDKNDPIKGNVVVTPTSATQHQGIRLELIGEIVMYFETKQSQKFTALVKELAGPGMCDSVLLSLYLTQHRNH